MKKYFSLFAAFLFSLFFTLPAPADNPPTQFTGSEYDLGDLDSDDDGLPNYAEYLINEFFQLANSTNTVAIAARLSPTNAYSSGSYPDYFMRLGELYLGELFTDHDRIPITWKLRYATPDIEGKLYVTPGQYSPGLDVDNDGWSAYAECRADSDPTDDNSYPVPTVKLKVTYNGVANLGNTLVIKAWNESLAANRSSFATVAYDDEDASYNTIYNSSYALGVPCAQWSIPISNKVSGIYTLGRPDIGYLREGKNTFILEVQGTGADTDTSDTTTSRAGLYGFASGVDVGWHGARATVALTDFSGITPRIELTKDSSDRTESVYTNDFRVTEYGTIEPARLDSSIERVRIARYAVNGYPSYESWDTSADVVFDRNYYSAGRTKLSEVDFYDTDEFDLDWASLRTEIINNRAITSVASSNLGRNITNMCYIVVFGNGNTGWHDSSDTTNVVHAHKALITKCFDLDRAIPNNIQVNAGIQYGNRPTFSWRIDEESEYAKKYGTSYTAFRPQIFAAKAGKTVYDPGLLRLPAPDAKGNYSWTAPICVGDLHLYNPSSTNENRFIPPNGGYYIRLTLFNSKFSDFSADVQKNYRSPGSAPFYFAVNQQQEINDHGYSCINAAVKYAGHSLVLRKSDDLSTMLGKVRVQAFLSPDFTGDPIASTLVTNAVGAISDSSPNAILRGLPATGTYYLRAYIDMDGDKKLSAFEPWGYAKEPVKLTPSLRSAPQVTVWIEDSDTDSDGYSDAYEYAAYDGWADGTSLGTAWSDIAGNVRIVSSYMTIPEVEINGYNAAYAPGDVTNSLYATLSRYLPGASTSLLQSENFVQMLYGGLMSLFDTSNLREPEEQPSP